MFLERPLTPEEARKQLKEIEVRARAIETIVDEHREKLGKPKEVRELLNWVGQVVHDVQRTAKNVRKHINDL